MGVVGSPSYMSPEQVKDARLTTQTDIYSLGVVMYELLIGCAPFNTSNLPALLNMILNEEPPLLRSFRQEIPEYLEMIIKRALSKNCDARYPTANDFAADIVLAFKHQKNSTLFNETNKDEKFKKLKTNKFFKNFFDSEIIEVINSSEWMEYRIEQKLIEEGELADSFYVIIEGEVEVKKGNRTLATLRSGDCFGEMAYLTKTKRTASIAALSGVTLLKITSALLEKSSVNCQLKFMKIFLNTLIERLSFTSSELSRTTKNIIRKPFKDTVRIR
jgi:serine/threonine protein kinase